MESAMNEKVMGWRMDRDTNDYFIVMTPTLWLLPVVQQ